MIRILLVDDQALVRSGFRVILELEPDFEVVADAADGIEAVSAAQAHLPDLVLMDIRMPRRDGLAATRDLLALPAPPEVVVLTTFDADEYIYEALRLGATGFLLKDISPEELAAAIRSAMSGAAMLSPKVTRRLVEAYVERPAPTTGVPDALKDLTDRELQVLREIAAGASNSEIAERLFLAETTVKTHVGRVFAKLGVRDRVQAVIIGYESGLVRPAR